MAAVRLNIMNIEFRDDMSRKFEQVHPWKRGVAVAIVGAQNVCAKRIRGYADALARMGGKSDMWFEIGIWHSAEAASCRQSTGR